MSGTSSGSTKPFMELRDGFTLIIGIGDRFASKAKDELGVTPDKFFTGDDFCLALVDGSGSYRLLLGVSDRKVVSIVGRDLSTPSKSLLERLTPFFRDSGIRPAFNNTITGFVIDCDGIPVAVNAMPNGMRVMGDCILRHADISALPDNFYVEGNLDVNSSRIEYLGQGLRVDGDLDISSTLIHVLPDDLTIGGDLIATDSVVARFPDRLRVAGTAFLSASAIRFLGSGSRFGSLILANTLVRELPDDIIVERDLDIWNTLVTTLPSGFSVQGSIMASGLDILALPDGLSVGGDLDLSNALIEVLPKRAFVGGRLILDGTKIDHVPRKVRFSEIHLQRMGIVKLSRSVPSETKVRNSDGEYQTAAAYRARSSKGFLASKLGFLIPAFA